MTSLILPDFPISPFLRLTDPTSRVGLSALIDWGAFLGLQRGH
jgi:hypothetical protein